MAQSTDKPRGATPTRHSRSLRAFTLIEILVVVAIIILLVAILIPSFKQSRDQVKQVTCGSNVHQQTLAVSMYAHDHRGSLPPNPTQSPYKTYLWTAVDVGHRYDKRAILRKYVNKEFGAFSCPGNGGPDMDDPVNEPFLRGGERWMGGHFIDLYNSLNVFKDPDWNPLSGQDPRPWAPRMDWSGGGSSASVPIIQDLFFVSTIYYINHGISLLPSSQHELDFHPPHGRYRYAVHQRSCTGINVAYLDGHAKWTRNMQVGGNHWTLEMPWSQATAGTLTVRANFRN